jgi:hypothetical protein
MEANMGQSQKTASLKPHLQALNHLKHAHAGALLRSCVFMAVEGRAVAFHMCSTSAPCAFKDTNTIFEQDMH